MLSDNQPYCHPSLQNCEPQTIDWLLEELVLAWQQGSRQTLLNKIIQAMRSTSVLDEVLQTTVNQLKVALGVSRCLIARPDPHNQMVVRYVSQTTDESETIIDSYCPFYRYYQETLALGEPVVLSPIDETLPPELLRAVQRDNIRALMIVPLMYQKSYIGGITLVQCDTAHSEHENNQAASMSKGVPLRVELAGACLRLQNLLDCFSKAGHESKNSSQVTTLGLQASAQELAVATRGVLKLGETLDTAQRLTTEQQALNKDEGLQDWTASDVEFMQTLADHCAIAIYQAELHQQLQTQLAERQQVEEALRHSEARYRAIVEDQTELICLFKPDGTITFVNDAYCRYFDKQRSELIGQTFLPTMPSDDRELITKNFRALSQEHPTNTYEHRIILPSGEVRWQQWSDRALFDEQGNFIECQAVGRDITQLKQAEDDIRKALEKEKELSELRSSFVSLVSHEFRTPLTIIQTSTELLEHYNHKWSDEKKQKHFTRIQSSVGRMTHLLDDVLTIGKAEAGKLKFEPSPLDLVAFCQDLVENLRATSGSALAFAEPGISSAKHSDRVIDFIIHNGCTNAQMDEKLLGHILTNLLSNAIKYSPNGGTVRFDLICTSDSAVFRIQDTGIGIPATDLEKLFESFRRASNVGNIPGTGLGLAIVKKCVDLHGGTISVESELGKGTTFTVTLPLNMSSVDQTV
jgi:PAS domain S-box-containing protein